MLVKCSPSCYVCLRPTLTTPQQSQIYNSFDTHVGLYTYGTCVFATIWCTRPTFTLQLVHTTFALRSIYEQRFVCECVVYAAPRLVIGSLPWEPLIYNAMVPQKSKCLAMYITAERWSVILRRTTDEYRGCVEGVMVMYWRCRGHVLAKSWRW